MAGTNLSLWGRAGAQAALGTTPVASATPANATVAAFSPNATVSISQGKPWCHPSTPFGLAFWTGAGAIVLLALIRHSLPR